MAKEIGSGAVRAFGYQQMREADAQRAKDARLRKSQGDLGASLMALSGDLEAGDSDDRGTLRHLGLAASADTGPIGQIASAIGKFKQMGAIEKKREADRGRKDQITKMLIKGADDDLLGYGLDPFDIEELEKSNPEHAKAIIGLARSEEERDRLVRRRDVTEERDSEKHEWLKSENDQRKDRHKWSEQQEKDRESLFGTTHDQQKELLKSSQRLSPAEHFQDNWSMYKGMLDLYQDDDGNPIIPVGAEGIYKGDYQEFLKLVNNKILPKLDNEATAKRIHETYEHLWGPEIKNYKDVMDLERVPPAILRAMVMQNHTTQNMGTVQIYNERIGWARKEYHEAFKTARPQVVKAFLGQAEAYVKSMVPSNAKKAEELPAEIADLMDLDTTGKWVLKADAGIKERAFGVLLNSDVWKDSEGKEQFDQLMRYETSAQEGKLTRLSAAKVQLVGQNPNLLTGFQSFNSLEQADSQVPRMAIGAIYQGPNGGLYKVQMQASPNPGEPDVKVGLPIDDKDEADKFRNESMSMPHPFYTPQETKLNTVFEELKTLLQSQVVPGTSSAEADKLKAQVGVLLGDIDDPSITAKWRDKFKGLYPTGTFAEGGYVTEPTNALIGEGGEDEYVIPESKMGAALENYEEGARGDEVVPSGVPSGEGLRIGEYGDTGDTGGSGRPGGDWALEDKFKANVDAQNFGGKEAPFPGFFFNVDKQFGVENDDGNFTPQELKDGNHSNAGWIPRAAVQLPQALADSSDVVAPVVKVGGGAIATLAARDWIKKGWGFNPKTGKPGKDFDKLLDQAVKEYETTYDADIDKDPSKKLSDAEKSKKVGQIKDDFLDKKAKQFGLKDEAGAGKKWTPERIKHLKHKLNSTVLRRWGSAFKHRKFAKGANLKSHKDNPDVDVDEEKWGKKTARYVGHGATAGTLGLLTVDAIQMADQILNAVPDEEKPEAVKIIQDLEFINMLSVDINATTKQNKKWQEFLREK